MDSTCRQIKTPIENKKAAAQRKYDICVLCNTMVSTTSYQVNFADCYVLANKRTTDFITSFLDHFLPDRSEAANIYNIPQFSEPPEIVFDRADDLINYLEQSPNELHAVYWLNNQVAALRGAMCIFTSDGQVIFGLYCETLRPDTRVEDSYLHRLQEFCDSAQGLILYEEPAPQDTAAFLERVKAKEHNKP